MRVGNLIFAASFTVALLALFDLKEHAQAQTRDVQSCATSYDELLNKAAEAIDYSKPLTPSLRKVSAAQSICTASCRPGGLDQLNPICWQGYSNGSANLATYNVMGPKKLTLADCKTWFSPPHTVPAIIEGADCSYIVTASVPGCGTFTLSCSGVVVYSAQ